MTPNECTRLLTRHAASIADSPKSDYPAWKSRHIQGWNHPRFPGELAVKQALQAYAAMADGFNAEDGNEDEGGIGRDGYFGEHALAMLQAVHAWLDMGQKSRLDSGAISSLIGELARASGVDPDQV
jgi:hypothetical protein